MLPNRIALNILYLCFKNTVAIISSYKSDLELNKLSDLFSKKKKIIKNSQKEFKFSYARHFKNYLGEGYRRVGLHSIDNEFASVQR